MSGDIILTAPCKVNLTLDVFPPRPDGYHDLDSLVVPFAPPADEVKVSLRPGTRRILFLCRDKTLPRDDANLAVRAARVFLERFLPEAAVTVSIRLEKRLPQQAGLGGGSSDAAAVLLALSRLTGLEKPGAELAAEIGSDVPLFLAEGPVRMQGRGEKVEPLGPLLPSPFPTLYGVLVKPEAGVPTASAYALLDSLPDRQPGNATGRLLEVLQAQGGIEEIGAALGNDFEAAILPRHEEIAAVHRALREAGAVRALLSGSGAAVFGLARDRDHARELVKQLYSHFPWVKLAVSR